MTLLALQRDLRAWLARDDEPAAARFGDDAAPGLRVYRNNYRGALAACLEDTFANTHNWIGGDAFHDAVTAHIARVPPSSWTLDAYPRDFPATLAILYPSDPEIAELAWIECALGEAFIGADAPALTADVIAEVDWDSAVLEFTPTLDHANLTTNAPALWAAMKAGQTPPAAETLTDRGAVLVWRRDGRSWFRAIDREELAALLWARGGMSFAAVCGMLVDAYGETDGVDIAGRLLGQWFADGLVIGVRNGKLPAPPGKETE